MPVLPALKRRRGQASDADLNRRHSTWTPQSSPAMAPSAKPRHSEQLPRRNGLPEFFSQAPSASTPAVVVSSPEPSQEDERPVSPPVQESNLKQKRFSMLRFRNASDSQLSMKAKRQAGTPPASPPLPSPPAIITTAPTIDAVTANASKPKMKLPSLKRAEKPSAFDELIAASKKERRKTLSEGTSGAGIRFEESSRPRLSQSFGQPPPPAYGEDGTTQLALPVNRLSESSRSDSSDVYAQTTTTTQITQTTTTFFRLPRRKKPGPLFPLPPKVVHDDSNSRPSNDKYGSVASRKSVDSAAAQLRAPQVNESRGSLANTAASPSHNAMARAAMIFAAPGSPLVRQDSSASKTSNKSSPSRSRMGLRGRSSTVTSLRHPQAEDALETPPLPSSRTSTSTARKSFGDLFNLPQRLRVDPMPGQASPISGSSTKNNSIQIARAVSPVVVPERLPDDTPAKYLCRLEEAVSRGVVASVLSKGSDTFSKQVLRSYMRSFGFFGDPMDMALRKLLMEVELPRETQHIDRCMQAFADRYHECNPGIFANPEQAYFIAFSLLILHTDVFNKNNKYKMQKADYIKNTRGEGTFEEILECFYDNISYTPFIHVEDDLDINGERIVPHKTKKKSLFPRSSMDPAKRASKEPIDPYTLIIDSKLDTLRPNLKEVMEVEEHYNYLGTAKALNLDDLQKTFFRTGVLQIISARSRPDAFMSDKTTTNPDEAHPGIVDIKITKVGLLWRKDAKRKRTRSPWQEWGAILTGAQLYFFRNTAWIKSLMHQHETHVKQGNDGIPVVFKPPIESFKPDALMSTDDAVALLDSTYKKHKNAFLFVRHGGFEETFLADSENEMNDWLAKLNYAAAFRTAGVRMRGVVGGNYEGQRTRGIRRLESANSGHSVQTPTGDVHIISGRIDNQMAQDILAARREIMLSKIADAQEKLAVATKQLDALLRNARHLQILAPIHPKTRENVVLAAGRMAAKLKWNRMEIWRLRCHSDILNLDLEEETKLTVKPNQDVKPMIKQVTSPSGLRDSERPSRTESKRSTIQERPTTPQRKASTHSMPIAAEPVIDDVFHQSPARESMSSFHRQNAAWELPQLEFSGLQKEITKASAKSPVLSHTSSYPNLRLSTTAEPNRAISNPQPDANEHIVLEQAGLIDQTRTTEPKPAEADENLNRQEAGDKEKDKADRGKVRRSIHKTLRDAHVPTHRPSRKGKEASGSKESDEAPRDDHLARGTGSFVVHGKKASVITFGDALANISPEERLRQKKPTQNIESPTSGGKEFDLAATLNDSFRERRIASNASTETATARSFRELHKRLSAHAATQGSADGGEDESDAAISFSDGRRTPLPPVEDADEELETVSENGQAVFYTPDQPGTPSTVGWAGAVGAASVASTVESRETMESARGEESSTPKMEKEN